MLSLVLIQVSKLVLSCSKVRVFSRQCLAEELGLGWRAEELMNLLPMLTSQLYRTIHGSFTEPLTSDILSQVFPF